MGGILYGELSIFTGNAHPQLARDICAYLGVPLGRAEVFEFTNENIFVKINQNVREHDVFVVQPTCAPVNKSVMELLIMLDALKRASASRITAVIPYFAYGRSDKKDQPRVPITARLLAELLQVAGCDRVLTMDLHAGQVQGFFRIPVDELTAMFPLADYFRAMEIIDPVVVAADLGFAKRARNFANMIGGSVAFVEKRRLGNDSNSESLGIIGDVRGRTAIIMDDEIDTAGSITNAAAIVKQEGAREVLAACTHAVLSGPAIQRIENSVISTLVTTDTCRIDPHKRMSRLRILPIGLHLGEAISRIHTGGSVGALFGVQA
ncbi:MAG: ribose-phosphate pyrophosphokinase [Chloroflexi bacterium]|nr:ribose-phosphate pyrophosphokinase [Chloroflexota bacterium]